MHSLTHTLESCSRGEQSRRSTPFQDSNLTSRALHSVRRKRRTPFQHYPCPHSTTDTTHHLSFPVNGRLEETAEEVHCHQHVRLKGRSSPAVTAEAFVFDSIESALEEIALGRFVVVLDDEHRENEGDLVAAAELVTTESIAFMVEHTSGVICVGMEGQDLDRLKLPLMVPPEQNTDAKCTAFTITVDLAKETTTGISASDRAKTLRALASRSATASEFRRPGHIFPLRYEDGGVLERRGHTEASVDLARLAGCRPAGVLCEIVDRVDGSMARTPELFAFAKRHALKIITIDDLVQYRQQQKS